MLFYCYNHYVAWYSLTLTSSRDVRLLTTVYPSPLLLQCIIHSAIAGACSAGHFSSWLGLWPLTFTPETLWTRFYTFHFPSIHAAALVVSPALVARLYWALWFVLDGQSRLTFI
ncbi:hypothetical protein EDB82DRAFT_497458 [Fusarium venenatum]|uniref:uncharacterized protein n=1 Tax=Fusarium venenatum TaxID=56646 RepID=UPI001DE03FAD|nr:hypothetical protein EDB82DRAFT_497458 [Fusarium venenatum]